MSENISDASGSGTSTPKFVASPGASGVEPTLERIFQITVLSRELLPKWSVRRSRAKRFRDRAPSG
ncbi:hypothetical protein [Natronoarchaeum rubrum]|uniref:hypothetical protein n=1 Tax=Natronoarchaeum rubrum TaxID=755311 RepID=UPI00211340CD|nr:hypothetical protein [Natronoarchaeum rubrum]